MKSVWSATLGRVSLACAVLVLVAGMHPHVMSNSGVVFEIETTYHSTAEPRVESTEMSVAGKMLKIGILPSNDPADSKSDAIFRGDRGEMIVVDHGSQSYIVINEAALEAMVGQMTDAMEEMRSAMQNVQIPPEVLAQMPETERKRIEALLKQQQQGAMQPHTMGGGTERPVREYRRTGERGRQHGYPCMKYEVLEDGKKVQELWVTDWDNVDGGDEVVTAFEAAASFFEEMQAALGDAFGGNLPLGDSDTFFGEMKEIGGFPVITREFDDYGSLESESVLRSSRRQTLDPDAFEPPAGYKRQEMFGGR